MGSHFRGMSKQEWEMELPRLWTSVNGEIESIMKFSYDALCDEDKDLFVYIACFFNGEDIEKVEGFLAENFSNVRQGLHVLAEKSLISTEEWGFKLKIKMHDLLVHLGREIVRKQSIHDLGQRKFLVDIRETYQVLSNYTPGGRNVIGIECKYHEIKDELYISDKVFERMSNLRFLRLRGNVIRPRSYLPERLKCLPKAIRLLHWDHFPMTCLPSNFNTKFLVEISMPSSKLEKLWEGSQTITNLKWMNLSDSKNLMELPDLSTAINLKELDLSGCSVLVELPASVGNATSLRELNLSDCSSLVELPSSIGNLRKLRSLTLKGCLKLEDLPININMESLEILDLTDCSLLKTFPEISTNIERLMLNGTTIEEVPSSIRSCFFLRHFVMSYSENLGKSLHAFDHITELYVCDKLIREIPPWIKEMSCLKELVISGCTKLVSLPQLPGSLKTLKADNCKSLKRLDSCFHDIKDYRLLTLNLSGCSNLVELPSSIENARELWELDLSGCSSLVELPSSIGNAIRLWGLNLSGCSSLVKLPSSIGNAMNLEVLSLSGCTSLLELPSSIGNAMNLEVLDLSGCSSLLELPSSIVNIVNLKKLNFSGCSSLVELPSSIGNATNLIKLDCSDCSSLVKLPSFIGNAINLKKLSLKRCSSLVQLPSSIGNLHNLSKMTLKGCSKLEALPININLESLETLDLLDCLLLRTFPEISTNIHELNLMGTAIEEIPSSIKSWSHLCRLGMSYCENLGKSPHAFDLVTVLLVRDKRTRELAPWIKGMSRLWKIVIRGCPELVSLPQFPDSLQYLEAENCESLERLDSSLHNTKVSTLYFANTFKLNQEARDLIIRTHTCKHVLLPGEKVPTHFLWRAMGSSLSMKWNGTDTHQPISKMRFKACVLLVNKGGFKVVDDKELGLSYCIKKNQKCIDATSTFDITLGVTSLFNEHLIIFDVKEEVSYSELIFEFEVNDKRWEIKECGLNLIPKL